MTFAIPPHTSLMASSIGTGAMFSPPAVMMSSLYRPVILSMPFVPMHPLSPLQSHPRSLIASRDLEAM
jgi:hypothetical protein